MASKKEQVRLKNEELFTQFLVALDKVEDFKKNRKKVEEVVEFIVTGKPVPKGRPRFTRTGHTYTDPKTKNAETRILAAYLMASRQSETYTGPVSIEVIATFTPPTSWPKAKKEAALKGEIQHTVRPDFDNLAKIVDGLNGKAWADDAQIVKAEIIKKYGLEPSTRIRVTYHERRNK